MKVQVELFTAASKITTVTCWAKVRGHSEVLRDLRNIKAFLTELQLRAQMMLLIVPSAPQRHGVESSSRNRDGIYGLAMFNTFNIMFSADLGVFVANRSWVRCKTEVSVLLMTIFLYYNLQPSEY